MSRSISIRLARALNGVILAFCGGFACRPVAAQMGGPATVETERVKVEEIQTGAPFVGTVLPLRMSIVGSEVEGKLVELLVDEGDRVEAGELLARVRMDTLEIELEAAKAARSLREAELAELNNGSRPEEVRASEAQADALQADVDYWNWQYDLTRKLSEQDVSSEDEVQESQRQRDRAAQQARAARAQLELVRKGPRWERIKQAEAQLHAQQEEVRRLEVEIEKHSIAAPFAGYVTAKQTEVGQWIGKGDPVVEIAELDEVEIEAAVPESDVAHVKIGAGARVEIDALPEAIFTGEVSAIVPQADRNSRTFPVKVRVKNQPNGMGTLIKAGMFARVVLSVGEKRSAVMAPKDALVLGGGRAAVYVAESGEGEGSQGTVRLAPVQLGVASGAWIEVTGEIKENDRVVVLGNERLMPGQAVKIVARLKAGGEVEGSPEQATAGADKPAGATN